MLRISSWITMDTADGPSSEVVDGVGLMACHGSDSVLPVCRERRVDDQQMVAAACFVHIFINGNVFTSYGTHAGENSCEQTSGASCRVKRHDGLRRHEHDVALQEPGLTERSPGRLCLCLRIEGGDEAL